jgi:cell division septal protein FtsQ
MRKRSSNHSSAPKKFRRLPLKPISAILILLIGLLFVSVSIGRFLINSELFRIKDIISNGNKSADLSYLKAKNIFTVNLQKETVYISQLYPDYRTVKLVRVLPSRLYAEFIKRKAIAIIKLNRYFCVDETGALFDVPEQLEGQYLPIILGLETKIFGARPGSKFNLRELNLALTIINELKLNKALKDYRIRVINVTNPSSTSFIMPLSTEEQRAGSFGDEASLGAKGLEIRIGADDISNKLNILAGLLSQEKNKSSSIKYIDLRFKDPVIKFNDAKTQ